MASEQPTHFATPSVFVYPASPEAEPIEITGDDIDIAEEARTFKPHLHHLDRIDPQFGFRPELAYTHLPPIPRARHEPSRSIDPSKLQVSGFINPSEPWRILDPAASPLHSLGPLASDSNTVDMIPSAFGDQWLNPSYNGQGQGERRN